MGCHVFVLSIIKYRGGPLTIIVPAGWYKDNFIERQIYVPTERRSHYIDFGNRRSRLGLEIDGRFDALGRQIHDVVADQQRDERLARAGWRVLRIPAGRVLPHAKMYNPKRAIDESKKWFE